MGLFSGNTPGPWLALGLPVGWREALPRELGCGARARQFSSPGLFLGLGLTSLVLVEIGVHEHLSPEGLDVGALGPIVVAKLGGAEVKVKQ